MKINDLFRKKLYELVWSKPLSTISIEFDISFLDLRKICTDYQIPIPRNGHWSKLKFSKQCRLLVVEGLLERLLKIREAIL